jgi:hypothetical protein
MKYLVTVLFGIIFSCSGFGQRTTFPVTVTSPGGIPNCSFEVEIGYCWENVGSEVETHTRVWTMGPGATLFAPILLGFEPNGEFSPPPSHPIVSIEIGGVTIDASNPCACFNNGAGCCFEVCISATHIHVLYFDCSDPTPPCTVVHSI